MTYEKLNKALSIYFPELKPLIDSAMDTPDCYKPSPHVLYGSVLNPYVIDLFRFDSDSSELHRVFVYFELLACSDDEEVRNLLQVTLLEPLWCNKDIYIRAQKYMHKMTKQINNQIKSYFETPTD